MPQSELSLPSSASYDTTISFTSSSDAQSSLSTSVEFSSADSTQTTSSSGYSGSETTDDISSSTLSSETSSLPTFTPSEATSFDPTSSEATTSEVTSSETAYSATSEATSSEESSSLAITTSSDIPGDCGSPLTTVALANPTPIFGNDVAYDDETAGVTLPFQVGIGDQTSDLVFVSPNGLLTLFGEASSPDNGPVPDTNLPEVAIMPFWDDLYFVTFEGHGVFYEVYPSRRGGREATFEWVGYSANEPGIFHFGLTFYENAPSIVNFTYFTIPDQGSSATVGSQKRTLGGPGYDSLLEWTFDTAGNVFGGFTLEMDHDASFAYTTGTFDTTVCGKRSAPLPPP
ncbi:hypothetical protein N0V84_002826 [Fusarium piperis]|uniref:Uncharacterized protein n=1 Tax=Fusarium piperis TaxID=1435070 RepID=A0A9W8WIR9_9HYPO|nr:hypothetical protein N0V84_002826 [Fusarium piperis]